MQVYSLNIGRPQVVVNDGQRYSTAINRAPVPGPIELGETGFAGDRVADDNAHGGSEMAACAYPHEHYACFSEKLSVELTVPSFGENLTTTGLLEAECCIGDVFRIGTAALQISKPREPCATLARKHNDPRLVQWILASRFSGFYFRVIEIGQVQRSDAIELIERPHEHLTVAAVMQARHDKQAPKDILRIMAECPALSPPWRASFAKRAEA